MADQKLSGRSVAVLATDGFEQSELEEPVKALKAAGARVEVVSPKDGDIQGMQHHEKGRTARVDRELRTAAASDYDALVLPGGVANPDTLRTVPEAVAFVRAFAEASKPIAAICHGPWTLINADAVAGRTMITLTENSRPTWSLHWPGRNDVHYARTAKVSLVDAIRSAESAEHEPAVAAGIATLTSNPDRGVTAYNVLLADPDGTVRRAVDADTGQVIANPSALAGWP